MIYQGHTIKESAGGLANSCWVLIADKVRLGCGVVPEKGWVRELGREEPTPIGRHVTHLEDTTVAEKYLLLFGTSAPP